MDTVKFSEIRQDAELADLYSKIYTIPKSERVKVLMSWLANAYSDLLTPLLSEQEVMDTYVVHIRLLDTFANNSAYDVVAQLASEFSENFLMSQVIPNFVENGDRSPNVTDYIHILCENLTCPSLICKLMNSITSQLTPILIARMTSDNPLVATATLHLLKCLLELYCEDLWYELMLQYLLPMRHLLTSQRLKMLPEIEFQQSTNKLLDLIPNHVASTINPSILAQHFLLYFQEEIWRLHQIDSRIKSLPPSSKSQLQNVGLSENNLEPESGDFSSITSVEDGPSSSSQKPRLGRNPTFPMWVFRYDGTDFLHALRKGVLVEEPEEFFEDDLFSVAASQITEIGNKTTNGDGDQGDLSGSEGSNDDNNVNVKANFDLQNGSIDQGPSDFDSLDYPSLNGFVKDRRKSFDNRLYQEEDSRGPYFGQFIHSLYEILKNWTTVQPDVLFVTTEIISVLASSRIPLINTLFLDMSLTLQPSYPSFFSLLHNIKSELESHARLSPESDSLFRNVWKAASKGCAVTGEETSFFSREEGESPPRFVSAIRRAFASNGSFRLAAEEMDRTVGLSRRSSLRASFTSFFKSPREFSSGNEFRSLNIAPPNFDKSGAGDDAQDGKVMALRNVLFTHWMLEMGSIAMLLCWGRKSIQEN